METDFGSRFLSAARQGRNFTANQQLGRKSHWLSATPPSSSPDIVALDVLIRAQVIHLCHVTLAGHQCEGMARTAYRTA